MLNTLRMQFGGIVCFAFSAGQAGIEKVHALLADARHPERGTHNGHHPPHVAALQFYTDQLSPNNRLEPDLRFRRPGSSREQGVVFLVMEDLEIEGTEDIPPVVVHGRTRDDAPANGIEEHDFFWVADIARLGVKGLKAGCVDTTMQAPDGLLARFNLRGGVLYTGDVERLAGNPIRASFIDPDSNPQDPLPYSQSLALWSEWEVPIKGSDEIAIRLAPFNNHGEPRRLVFSTTGLPLGDSLWASVKNVTMADLLEVSAVIDPSKPAGILGSHFDLHYTLADPMPMPAWIPDPGTATDGKPLCPPAQLMIGG